MKTYKKTFSIMIAICLVFAIVEFPAGYSVNAASSKKIIIKEKEFAIPLKDSLAK